MTQQNLSNDEDKFYTKRGVTPPSRVAHLSEADVESALKEGLATAHHEWRQQGPRLFCVRCPLEHGTEPKFKDYLLVGTDNKGLPILKKL